MSPRVTKTSKTPTRKPRPNGNLLDDRVSLAVVQQQQQMFGAQLNNIADKMDKFLTRVEDLTTTNAVLTTQYNVQTAMVDRRLKETDETVTTITTELKQVEHRLQESWKKDMENFREDLNRSISDATTRLNVVSTRVDILERWRWMIIGGSLVIGFAFSKIPWSAIFSSAQ